VSTDFDIPTTDSTLRRVHGIDSGHMKRAALYARVSTDKQSLWSIEPELTLAAVISR